MPLFRRGVWEKVKQCLEGTGGCLNIFICFNLHSNINCYVIIFLKYLEYYTAINGLLCDLMTKSCSVLEF